MGDVAFLVGKLREAGLTVHEWSGWSGRGNGGVGEIDIRGAIIHHTGTGYGFAFPALVTGRPDLPGALCNFAGNVDGSVTVIASGLAYHAGGGFGPNQGPLAPYANNRNYYTAGLEIVYPGGQPMTDAQYRTALIFARVVADNFADGNLEYVRGHFEVNGAGYEGKWDPGFAPGTPIDMNEFRNEARTIEIGDDVSASEVWAFPIENHYNSAPPAGKLMAFLDEHVNDANAKLDSALTTLANLTTALAALSAKVAKLEGSGIPAVVDNQAVAEAVANELHERGAE